MPGTELSPQASVTGVKQAWSSRHSSAQPAAWASEIATLGFAWVVFFGAAAPAQVERRIAAVRAALERGADPATLGDATMLPPGVDKVAVDLIGRDFGEGFARELEALPVGQWSGAVVSGFGTHLVKVSERVPAALPPLEAVRPQVAREWENDRRTRALEEDYRRLRQRYEVVIDAPAPRAAGR
jgi:hypothetical protein